jgi:hypothetical protein
MSRVINNFISGLSFFLIKPSQLGYHVGKLSGWTDSGFYLCRARQKHVTLFLTIEKVIKGTGQESRDQAGHLTDHGISLINLPTS